MTFGTKVLNESLNENLGQLGIGISSLEPVGLGGEGPTGLN